MMVTDQHYDPLLECLVIFSKLNLVAGMDELPESVQISGANAALNFEKPYGLSLTSTIYGDVAFNLVRSI